MSYRYTPGDPNTHNFPKEKKSAPRTSRKGFLIYSSVLIFSWSFCLYVGYSFGRSTASGLSLQDVTFQYNRTFALAPSTESDKAWDDLFPEGTGFIKSASGNITSAISVFHQLHCLNTLRHVTYELISEVDGHPPSKDGEEHRKHARNHAMHCFDYLRQGIQCAADGSLETVIPDLGGVSGWGATHKCRDFEAQKRRASSSIK